MSLGADGGNVIVPDIDEVDYAKVNSDKAADEVGFDPVTEANEEGFDPVARTPLDIENPADNPGDEKNSEHGVADGEHILKEKENVEEENEENSEQGDSEHDAADDEHILKEKKSVEEEDVLAVENVSPVESVPPADDGISNHSTEPEGEEEEEVDDNTGDSSQVVEVDESTEVTPAVAVADEVEGILEEEDEMVRHDDSSAPFVENDLEEGTDTTRNFKKTNEGTVTSPPAIDGEEVGASGEDEDENEATSSLSDEVGQGNDDDASSRVEESINDVSVDSVESA